MKLHGFFPISFWGLHLKITHRCRGGGTTTTGTTRTTHPTWRSLHPFSNLWCKSGWWCCYWWWRWGRRNSKGILIGRDHLERPAGMYSDSSRWTSPGVGGWGSTYLNENIRQIATFFQNKSLPKKSLWSHHLVSYPILSHQGKEKSSSQRWPWKGIC